MFGENECLQALGATVAVAEPLLELAGGGAAARIEFAAGRQPRLRATDHDPANKLRAKAALGLRTRL